MKKRNKHKLAVIASLLIISMAYIYFSSANLIFEMSCTKFKFFISNSSYYAVEQCMKEGLSFDKLFGVEKNSNGDIVFIYTDSMQINYLAKKMSVDCCDYITQELDCGIDVPCGVFTGLRLFSGFGDSVNLKIISYASVDCRIVRSFENAGINQTRQTLTALIHTDISVMNLFTTKHFYDEVQVVLFDNIIVGKIPEIYFSSESGFGSSSKLVG